jgi:rhodanese-related sulfurtransferase
MRLIISAVMLITIFSISSPLWASTDKLKWENERQAKWMETKTKEITEQTKKEVKTIDIHFLQKAIESDEDFTLLDVRSEQEFYAAHIDDSVNLPRGLVEFAIWSLVEDVDETIYVYCTHGPRAFFVTKMLNDLGYKNAIAVDTGILQWVQSGYPVKTSLVEQLVFFSPAS